MITNARKTEHAKIVSPKAIKGNIIIDGKAYPADEVIEAALAESYSDIKHDGNNIILGGRRISPIYKSEQEKAMASLCYGSLIYCCPASKPCPERDHALEVLGMTIEEYDRLKERFHFMMLEYAQGLWTPDDMMPQGTIRRPKPQIRNNAYARTYQRSDPNVAISRGRNIRPQIQDTHPEEYPHVRDNSWEEMLDFPDLFDDDGRPRDRNQWPKSNTEPAGLQPMRNRENTVEKTQSRRIPPGLSSEVGFCLNCGASIPKGATYCKKCGHPV